MTIAIWADNILDANMSGMGHHQAQVLQALDTLVSCSDYTVFYTPRRWGQQFPIGFEHLRVRALPGLRHIYYPLWHVAGQPSVDVFLGKPSLVHLLHASVTVPTRRRAIVWVVDLASTRYPSTYPARRRAFKDRALRRAAARSDILFMANSEFVKRELCDLYDVAPDRVVVNYLGVDHERFAPVSNAEALERVRAAYDLKRPFFLFVGLFNPRKNIVPLIEGVTEFNRRTGADYQLLLAGASGWQDEDVFRAATAAQCVNMSGYVPDADLPALYSLAEALVYPSSYEGFGLPPLEAMACGVPVLAANSSCLPEVIGDAGLLLEEISPDAIADALTRLMSSDELRADLVRRGLTRASSFTWRQTAEKCLKLYQLMEAGRA